MPGYSMVRGGALMSLRAQPPPPPPPPPGGPTIYTPTHFVAPYTMVPGATSDNQDLGEAAYSNAQSPGLWTTYGTALSWARRNHNVMLRRGIYVTTTPSTARTPGFRPVGDTLADATNRVIFFAEQPAAYSEDSSLYTEIRRDFFDPSRFNPDDVRSNAAMGPHNADHVIFDGFFADENFCPSGPAQGMFNIDNGSIGSQYRRCRFRRGNNYPGGFNAQAIFMENNIDSKVLDCLFTDRVLSYGGNLNQTSSIEVYASSNYLLKHNEFRDNFTGIYIKENRTAVLTYGRQCYNKYTGHHQAFGMQQGDNEADHNLVYLPNSTAQGAGYFMQGGPPRPIKTWNVHHNTFVMGASGGGGIIGIGGPTTEYLNCQFVDNIVVAAAGFAGRFTQSDAQAWEWARWLFDRNRYFAANGVYTFTDPHTGTAINGFANWQNETTAETNSSTGDPLFVDAANHDYRLQLGSPALGKGCFQDGDPDTVGKRAVPNYAAY